MKMKIITIVLISSVILIGAYRVVMTLSKDHQPIEDIVTPVKVVSIEASKTVEVLTYQGRVAPSAIEKMSFKSSGRLLSFNGEVGDLLEPGFVLAKLDTVDLDRSLEAAENQFIAASANYDRANKGARAEDKSLAALNVEKAEKAVTYLRDKVEDVTALYGSDVVSLSELDKLKLELSVAESDLALAKKSYDKALAGSEAEVIKGAEAQKALAATNIDAQKSLIEDASLILTSPRVLIDQLYEPEELVPAGHPVAILRSIEQVVMIGVTGKDLEKVYIGQPVQVTTNRGNSKGEITRIAQIPDASHFLYEVEVSLGEQEQIVGDIAKCNLILGERKTVRVPITSVLNDGIDYVFVVDNGLAKVRQIVIEEIDNGYAIVSGLEVGDEMIVNNLNRIHENSLVTIDS